MDFLPIFLDVREQPCLVVGGGEAPQMGQCVTISSRSSVAKPMMTKKVRLPVK